MRRVRVRETSGGIQEVVPTGRFQRRALLAGYAVLLAPPAVMVVFAAVAVLPLLAFALPVIALVGGTGLVWLVLARSAAARRHVAPVIPLWR